MKYPLIFYAFVSLCISLWAVSSPSSFLFLSLLLLLLLSFSTLLWNSASQRVPQSIRTKHYQTPFSGTSYTSPPNTYTHAHSHWRSSTSSHHLPNLMTETQLTHRAMEVLFTMTDSPRYQVSSKIDTHMVYRTSVVFIQNTHSFSCNYVHMVAPYTHTHLHNCTVMNSQLYVYAHIVCIHMSKFTHKH